MLVSFFSKLFFLKFSNRIIFLLSKQITILFLSIKSNFAELNEVFLSYFDGHLPARSAVQVSALPMNARVEIEAIGTI